MQNQNINALEGFTAEQTNQLARDPDGKLFVSLGNGLEHMEILAKLVQCARDNRKQGFVKCYMEYADPNAYEWLTSDTDRGSSFWKRVGLRAERVRNATVARFERMKTMLAEMDPST